MEDFLKLVLPDRFLTETNGGEGICATLHEFQEYCLDSGAVHRDEER